MGIKYDENKKHYVVSYSRRHPITKQSRGLRRQGIKTKYEAEKVYRGLIIKLANKFNEAVHPLWPIVVEDFLTFFANRGIANNTLINYKSSLELHTCTRWENIRINEITTSDIRNLILEDLSTFSESHRKSMLKFIRAVFHYALECDIIQRIKKVLNENEIKILLSSAKAVNHEWFPIWGIACFTGMRSGELYALKWDCVDLDKRTIVVSNSWTKENGYKDTKSGNDRVVEIAESLMPTMMNLYNKKSNEFVLPRIKEWTTGCQANVLKSYLAKLNLPLIRFHDLRASWATVMLSKGVEPIKVMSMGGWKDLKTMQIYIRKSGIHIKGITNILKFL
jgi:integrase